MEIICDTHIWYNIGNGHIDLKNIEKDNKLIATFNNIDEFSRTSNLVDRPVETRKAVQSMFKYSKSHAIFEPPFIYLKKISDPKYNYDIRENHLNIMTFTEKIAKGYEIELSKIDEYITFCEQRKSDLKYVADFFNKQASSIKEKIMNKDKHRKENSIPINRELISLFVSSQSQTKEDSLPANFDWKNIELFENTLKVFFNALETGAMSVTANDWYDLFLLIYVNPERKIWTREKKSEAIN